MVGASWIENNLHANSHPMKQKMPRAPYSQLAAMDFAKSPTIFKSIYLFDY
jgi:hypothetical protein